MTGLERTRGLLASAPTNVPVALLIRHAERPEPAGLAGAELELTPRGRDESCELGRLLGARLRSVAHSPVLRCRQTAEAIRSGADASVELVADRQLGGPGLFVSDERTASKTFAEHGVDAILTGLVAGRCFPGLARPDVASAALVDHMLAACTDGQAGFYSFITHDALLAPTLGWLFGPAIRLPSYLDGLMIWRSGTTVYARHRGMEIELLRS